MKYISSKKSFPNKNPQYEIRAYEIPKNLHNYWGSNYNLEPTQQNLTVYNNGVQHLHTQH